MPFKTLLTTLGSSLGSLGVKAKMPLTREVRAHRAAQVQQLNALARKFGEQQLKDGAAKATVEALIATLESKTLLTDTDKKELANAAGQYRESFTTPHKSHDSSDTENDDRDDGDKGAEDKALCKRVQQTDEPWKYELEPQHPVTRFPVTKVVPKSASG